MEYAKRAVVANPDMSNRVLADEVGVGETTIRRAREAVDDLAGAPNNAPVEPETRTGKDGKQYPAHKQMHPTTRRMMDRAEKLRAHWDATGTGPKILSIKVRRAKPIGRMPDNTRERFQAHIEIIKERLVKLHKLVDYADQMSDELRHLLADELSGVGGRAKQLAKDMLGKDDLRKINRPMCDVVIPLRKEDEEQHTLQ
jgi:hypothetical protein